MHCKIVFTFFIYLICLGSMTSQTSESLFDAPDDWISERIPFPLSFAPDIDFTGFEDLKFAPHWRDENHPEFWTYTYVWAIDQPDPLTNELLAQYLELYYDGLMRVNEKRDGDKSPRLKTQCELIQSGENYTGEIQVFDHFFTKKMTTFFIKVKNNVHRDKDGQYILIQISTKPFSHEIWQLFESVKLKV